MTDAALDPALDPELAALLAFMASTGNPPMHELSPQEARVSFRKLAVDHRDPALLPPVRSVEDGTVPGPAGEVPVRIYRPEVDGPLPTVVFFHGGGFVVGDLDTHDLAARTVATTCRAVVVSVDYRLAPEHPYPAAVDDCLAAAEWVCEHSAGLGGDGRVAVAGDSAGGNLSAVVAQQLRTAGRDLAGQLLIYPVTDQGGRYPSHQENAAGYFLDIPTMRWFGRHYAGPDGVDTTDPRFSPLHGDVTGVAPAVVVVAQFDPLRDDGAAYARKLAEAGVPVTTRTFPGLIHGFFDMGRYSRAAQAAVEETCALFGAVLHA